MSYAYDVAGNLTSKAHSVHGVTVNYGYDALNRVVSRSYTILQGSGVASTPSVSYAYDTAVGGVGRLARVTTSGVSETAYTAYDAAGRVTSYQQATHGQSYAMTASYNKAGLVVREQYPSGRAMITEYDGAGRVAGVRHEATGQYDAGAAASSPERMHYTAAGAVSAMRLGNGLWEHTHYNSRLQPREIGLGATSTTSTVLKLEYGYGTTTNNGNLLSQTVTLPSTSGGQLVVRQDYTYDAVNRLLSAEEKVGVTSQWRQAYGYDVWGNRFVGLASTYVPQPGLTPRAATDFSTATNQLRVQGYGYDAAGNLKSDPAGAAMGYDGENRQVSYTKGGVTTSYVYDGDGRRVKKVAGGMTTVYVYNAMGQLVSEHSEAAATGRGTSYVTADHLGSARVITDASGVVKGRHDYLPFGEEIEANRGSRTSVVGYTSNDGLRQKFTAKERDTESGLDYFLARYYSAAQGRFILLPLRSGPPIVHLKGSFSVFAEVDLGTRTREDSTLDRKATCRFGDRNPQRRYFSPRGCSPARLNRRRHRAVERTLPRRR